MQSTREQALELFDYTRDMRRDFHRHPEMGFHEVRTAGIVATELRALGMEVTTGVAQTGVVGVLEGAAPGAEHGKILLLRFDMDALPIQEQTGLEFASENPGVMHACGHDSHVAIGLTVARMLAARRNEITGAVKFIFQPAEEGAGGAEGMLAAGVLQNPTVDYALAMHIWNEAPTGWVAVPSGALMAGADIFRITLEGHGGHGALPQMTIDPVIACAQIITGLQTIVSRNLSPLDTAVVSVCQVKAGDAFNVIPQTAEMSGTLRTFEPEIRAKVLDRLEGIVQNMAAAFGCKASVEIKRMTPALINNAVLAELVRGVAAEHFPQADLGVSGRSMVSEDMAYILEQVPGCFVLVGSKNETKGANFGHHHPRFTIDEEAMPAAAALLTDSALAILSRAPVV